MQNISRSSSSSTSSPSKAIFAQDGHRPSNHCIKTAPRPQAQLKTATGAARTNLQVGWLSMANARAMTRWATVMARATARWARARELMRCEKGRHPGDLRRWVMADTDDQAQPPPEDPHQSAQQEPDAVPPAQEDSPLAQEAPTYPQPDNTNRPKYIVKMRRVPLGWSAIWDPTSGCHWYWQPDTDVTTWDLPLVRHLPKATLHPMMATATSTVLQDTGHQQPPGSLATEPQAGHGQPFSPSPGPFPGSLIEHPVTEEAESKPRPPIPTPCASHPWHQLSPSGSGDQNTPPLCFECAREMDPLRPCVELGCTHLCDTCCLLREVKFLWKNFDDVRRQDAENLNVQLRLAASSLRFAGLPLVLPPASASIARRATPQSIVSTTRPGHIVKMRPVPRGWSAIWDPLEGAHLYWQRDTGVTTWDLPLVHLLPKATLHPLMATATSTVPQDTGQQQPPGSSTTRHC